MNNNSKAQPVTKDEDTFMELTALDIAKKCNKLIRWKFPPIKTETRYRLDSQLGQFEIIIKVKE